MATPHAIDFAEAWQTHRQRIYVTCFRFLRNPATAEDLCSEVFLRAWTHYANFRGDSQLSTWLHRIAVNTCLMHIRKYRQTVLSLDELEEQHIQEGLGAYMDAIAVTDRDLDGVVDRETICAALVKLPVFLRTPVELGYADGYGVGEIADILGVTVPAAKSRQHRGRREMRRILTATPTNPENGGVL
jgi:RNA polymerase sigma-70 factor (ECF subfamily)